MIEKMLPKTENDIRFYGMAQHSAIRTFSSKSVCDVWLKLRVEYEYNADPNRNKK